MMKFFKNKINVENDFIPTYLNVIVIKCDVAREQIVSKVASTFLVKWVCLQSTIAMSYVYWTI